MTDSTQKEYKEYKEYKANANIPWVEKYRPNSFNDIVLDPYNKILLENMINKEYFPNMLLYGPPGTGKTTTIINLINTFQEKHNQKNKGLIIHLNASDDRGIDIIRNQISQFVNSQSLFATGLKFVILDEVDYMTKTAQHALKYLIQSYNINVRFCLICNYISRIDESLQNEFMRLRFNQLPESNIISFLTTINEKEGLNIPIPNLLSIQKLYKSDIRSMINYIQSNQNMMHEHKVIDNSVWHELTLLLSDNEHYKKAADSIDRISNTYNIEIKNIIKDYLNYIIRYKKEYISPELFDFIEFIMHISDLSSSKNHIKEYTIIKLHAFFTVASSL
jgi:DNA polymerase III delta prime subunit